MKKWYDTCCLLIGMHAEPSCFGWYMDSSGYTHAPAQSSDSWVNAWKQDKTSNALILKRMLARLSLRFKQHAQQPCVALHGKQQMSSSADADFLGNVTDTCAQQSGLALESSSLWCRVQAAT